MRNSSEIGKRAIGDRVTGARRRPRLLAGAAAAVLATAGALVALGGPAAATPGGTAAAPPLHCVGTGSDGHRIQALYVYEPGSNHFSERESAIRAAAWEAQENINDSARRDGAQRWARFLTTATGCQLVITQVEVPTGTSGSSADDDNTVTALQDLGYNATDRIYAVYQENSTFCGLTPSPGVNNDETPGTGNRYNNHAIYAMVTRSCWDGHTLTHELAHAFGGLLPDAPHNDGTGHCTDGYDTLCQPTSGTLACPDPMATRTLDCGDDDYFAIDPQGSFLPTHFNAALDSLYLEAGSSVTPLTAIPPLPPQFLHAVDVQGTSIAFAFTPPGWPQGMDRPSARFQLLSGGTVVATVTGASHASTVLLTGLSTNTTYSFTMRTVVTVGGVDRTSVDSPALSVTTGTSLATAGAPSDGHVFVFTNDVLYPTGAYLAMDDGYSSTAEGNQILQYLRNDKGLNQQWQATAVWSGSYTLMNELSGKCLTVQGGSTTPGTAIVQSTCLTSMEQRWWFVSLGSDVFELKASIGTNLCVQAAGASTAPLTGLVTATCDSTESTQRWTANQLT